MTKTGTHRLCACCLFVLIALLCNARTSAADTLTLTWNLNPEPEVIGYLVYVGTESGIYTDTIDVENTNAFVLSSAVHGQNYCFAIAAYADGFMSGRSQEVCGGGNAAPTLTNPGSQTGRVGQLVSLQLIATDPEGAPLAYTATGLPPGVTLSVSLGLASGTPTTSGSYAVTADVSDGSLSAQQSFTWVIQSAAQNAAPTLVNPGTQASTVGQQIVLQLQASDDDGDPLVYSASGLPAGLQLASTTGRISGTPTTAATYSVTVGASDGRVVTSQAFAWAIAPAPPQNTAPTLEPPANQTDTLGQPASLQLQAADANGDPLTYSASGLPPGLELTAASGRIAGTPSTQGVYTVIVTVRDGSLSAMRSFTWTIDAKKHGRGTTRQISADVVYTGSTAMERPPAPALPAGPTRTPTGSAAMARTADLANVTTAFPVIYAGTSAVLKSIARRPPEQGVTYTGTSAIASATPAAHTVDLNGANAVVSENANATPPDWPETGNGAALGTAGSQPTAITAPVAAPAVRIETPVDLAQITAGGEVIFAATARDAKNGDTLTKAIAWTSSLDGRIGTGGLIHRTLTPGTHVITASVVDSRGLRGSAEVTVIVTR